MQDVTHECEAQASRLGIMIACRSVVMQQQLPSNEWTQGFMDSEYLLGLGTWATCQNGLSTTCYNSLENRANEAPPQEAANMGFYLYVPLWKLSVNLKCWWVLGSVCTPTGIQADKGLCALLLVDHFCSPSISFQLPWTNEIGVRKKLWDMGHMWQGSSTYLIMSHVLHHHHHLGGLERQVNHMYLAFYIAQYKNLLPYCQLSLSLTSSKQMLCTRSLNYSIIITHFVWETLLATFPFPTYLTIPPCPYYLSILLVVAPGTTCHMAPFQQFTCLPTTSYIPSWRCLAIDSKHLIMSLGWKMSLEMSL